MLLKNSSGWQVIQREKQKKKIFGHKKTLQRTVRLYNVGEKIRTPDLLVRSQTLYPAELRPHIIALLQQQYVLYMMNC